MEPPWQKPDETLEKEIREAWIHDPVTDLYEIDVTVEDGVALLTGEVDSFQEAHLAQKVASAVAGVREIQNRIVISYEGKRQDDEIASDVEAALKWDVLLDDAFLEVEVREGQVFLSGTVESAAQKKRAMLDAWVMGVVDVDACKVEVPRMGDEVYQPPEPSSPPLDVEIQAALSSALALHPSVDATAIQIQVQDGKVFLEGNVDSLGTSLDAEQVAWTNTGVKDVANGIDREPEGGGGERSGRRDHAHRSRGLAVGEGGRSERGIPGRSHEGGQRDHRAMSERTKKGVMEHDGYGNKKK